MNLKWVNATFSWIKKETGAVTYPPAAPQHPSSPAIRAFWGAAERHKAPDTSRASPFEMLTSP